MAAKAKFVKIAATGNWGILTPVVPEIGSEWHIRKANGDTAVVIVASVITTHAGGTVCSIVDRRTVSAPREAAFSALTPGQQRIIRREGYERGDGFDEDYGRRRSTPQSRGGVE